MRCSNNIFADYRVGCSQVMSPIYTFKTSPSSSNAWVQKVAVIADLGYEDAYGLPALIQASYKGDYHLYLHVGMFLISDI